MKAVFADSSYFFAVMNPADEANAQAKIFSKQFDGLIVSSAWVFTELGDGLCSPRDRAAFIRLLQEFTSDPLCKLVAPTLELFQAGVELFRDRPDKSWSLTDCISFIIMKQENLTDALTADHHFTQAGFNAVLAQQ